MKKRIFSLLATGCLSLQLLSPVYAAPHSNDFLDGTTEYTISNMVISIPTSWYTSESGADSGGYISGPSKDPNELCAFSVNCFGNVTDYSEDGVVDELKKYAAGLDGNSYISDVYISNTDSYTSFICDFDEVSDGRVVNTTSLFIHDGTYLYHILFRQATDNKFDYDRDFTRIIDSISITSSANATNTADYETGITYEQLARTPDDYKGKKVQFTGKVLQTLESESEVQIRFAIDSDYDTVLYCGYDPAISSVRILENDIVTIYGTSIGLISYDSTLGQTITIPAIYIEKIELAQ